MYILYTHAMLLFSDYDFIKVFPSFRISGPTLKASATRLTLGLDFMDQKRLPMDMASWERNVLVHYFALLSHSELQLLKS